MFLQPDFETKWGQYRY